MCYVCDCCNQPFLFMAKRSYVSHLKLHAEDRIFIKKRNKIIEKNKRIKNEMSLYGIREAFEKILFDNCYHVIINFLRFDVPLVNSHDGEFNLDKNLLEKPEYKFLDLYIDNKTVVIEYEFKNLEVNIFSIYIFIILTYHHIQKFLELLNFIGLTILCPLVLHSVKNV